LGAAFSFAHNAAIVLTELDSMADQNIEPSIERTIFTCPHCQETGRQAWFNLYADQIRNEQGLPLRLGESDLQRLRDNPTFSEDKRKQVVGYWERVVSGKVFVDRWAPCYSELFVANVSLSICHACEDPVIWLRDQIIHPV